MARFKLIRKFAAAAISVCTLATGLCGCNVEAKENMRDMTTMEVIQEMGLGINLGNTFESCGSWISNTSVTNYETGWGSPVVTKEMIQGLQGLRLWSTACPRGMVEYDEGGLHYCSRVSCKGERGH